jgi:proline racemase
VVGAVEVAVFRARHVESCATALVAEVRERLGLITGLHQYLVEPSDPFQEGYLVAETWGVGGADTQG